MKTILHIFIVVLALMVFGITGCLDTKPMPQPKADAVAVLIPAEDSGVEGVVRFAKAPDGVRVMARIEGLAPGLHGFHVHAFGDCRSADFSSAGAHYNPLKKAHGSVVNEERHAGDLGNIVADESGVAIVDMAISMVHLDGPDSIIGRSVIVHADPDDFTTQPSGGAGKRLACGVIGIAAE